MKRIAVGLAVCFMSVCFNLSAQEFVLFSIGEADNSSEEFALSPSKYEEFIDYDFGWENNFFVIGVSKESEDWPYVLPGPSDTWGGTWGTAGWRTSVLNALFTIDELNSSAKFRFVLDIRDWNGEDAPTIKIRVNGKERNFELPLGAKYQTITNPDLDGEEYIIEVPFNSSELKVGGNEISITTIKGSWFIFDEVRLECSEKIDLTTPKNIFIRDVKSADYSVREGRKLYQPLLVDIEYLSGTPNIAIEVDGEEILSKEIEMGRYVLEAPMRAVDRETESSYTIKEDGEVIAEGTFVRSAQPEITPARYASTMLGSAHSRWMIAPGPWMPFSMVKISPDNQNAGWQAGYDPIFETVGGFSHIHEWTMGGLSTMPTNGRLITKVGDERAPDEGYRSRIDKETEEGPVGYYKVDLTDYDIKAELTATTRCSFQRYTFPKDRDGSRVLYDLQIPAEYSFELEEVYIKKRDNYSIEGYVKQHSSNVWSGGINQDYIVHFVSEFDQPIESMGVWTDKGVQLNTNELKTEAVKDAGAFIEFNTEVNQVVQVRTGISYVSIEGAENNLEQEVRKPYNWSFEAVREGNIGAWDNLFSRVKIETDNQMEKMRFYSNMYRALCSRNIFSDIDGKWVDADEVIREFENSDNVALGCDAFWNTFWNLNQFWNLVTPEWSNRWVNSQLAMYENGGWLAKGPAGMEYIPVMVAEHEIPLIVSTYQMGIRDYDVDLAFEACKKMQTTPGTEVGGGYAGNRDLEAYLEHKYVPDDLGRFSNSLEYSFDDWTVGQFAKSLGRDEDYKTFNERGYYWKNVIDSELGYARLRNSKGEWEEDFDPYKSGANHHYVEGNSWQLTFFVPQDVPALADMIGVERFIERMDWGFTESFKTRFNGKNDQYWNYPVMQGNQQSMHFAYLFNWVKKPWLTQKWSRSIIERYYGYGLANAYLGDEDQGQMSGWLIMSSIGLFQTDGGTAVEPQYEIGSPLYKEVVIDLGKRYGRGGKFTIKANNTSRKNIYVQSAKLNGRRLNSFKFSAKELLKGGKLELEMGPTANKSWGVE